MPGTHGASVKVRFMMSQNRKNAPRLDETSVHSRRHPYSQANPGQAVIDAQGVSERRGVYITGGIVTFEDVEITGGNGVRSLSPCRAAHSNNHPICRSADRFMLLLAHVCSAG